MTTILNIDSDYSSLNDYIDDIMDSDVNDVEVNVLSHDRKPCRYRAAENHGPRRFYTVSVEAGDGTQYSETLETSDLIDEEEESVLNPPSTRQSARKRAHAWKNILEEQYGFDTVFNDLDQ